VAFRTTRWIVVDKTADSKGIIAQIANVPILVADLDFSQSRFEGLRTYEAGAGGATLVAMAKSEGSITKDVMLREIEKNYARLI
jgi:NaMN:DMB phosphoribosyltransferase